MLKTPAGIAVVAQQLLDKLGASAPQVLDMRAAFLRREGDERAALYWQQVANEARSILFFDAGMFVPNQLPIQLPLGLVKDMFYGMALPSLLLRPDLKIAGANPAHQAATMTHEAEVIGCDVFDVFPDNPEAGQVTGTLNLGASFRRVLDSGRPDQVALQRYDVRDRDGVFEERWWKPVNTPVFDEAGQLCLILHQAEDVTGRVRARKDTVFN